MNLIIKINLLLLFMFLTVNSFGQSEGTTIEKRVDRLAEYLELDAGQKVAVTIIFSEYGNQLKMLRLKQKSKSKYKEAYRKSLKDQDQALLDVFDDTQKARYTDLRRGKGKLQEGQKKENEMEKRARKNNRKIEVKRKHAKKKSVPMVEEYLIDPFE